MIAVPAVDLRGGRCVQLVGGDPGREPVSLPDPVAVARKWRALGFRSLHVVDLDGALEAGENRPVIARIAADAPGDLQVGGGIRDGGAAEAVIAAGADRIIVGTRAISDPGWLEALSARHAGRVIVAADVRDGIVLERGWSRTTGLPVGRLLGRLGPLPLAGILWTDVGREGQARGIDRAAAAEVLSAAPHPVWVAGGVTTTGELRFLSAAGAAGAVLGMALYTRVLEPEEVAEEFGR